MGKTLDIYEIPCAMSARDDHGCRTARLPADTAWTSQTKQHPSKSVGDVRKSIRQRVVTVITNHLRNARMIVVILL